MDDENLDLTGLREDKTFTCNLQKFLPSGIYFGDEDFSGTASVVVHVAPVVTETFDVEISNIAVDGEAEGFKVFVDDSEYTTVSLTLQGLSDSMQNVSEAELKGTVSLEQLMQANDMEELRAGTYSADITWTLPSGVTPKGTVSVYVTVEENS